MLFPNISSIPTISQIKFLRRHHFRTLLCQLRNALKRLSVLKNPFEFCRSFLWVIKGLQMPKKIRGTLLKCPIFRSAVDYSLHYISLHFSRKPYALVSGITKKRFTAEKWSVWVNEWVSKRVRDNLHICRRHQEPIHHVSRIHELKRAFHIHPFPPYKQFW